MDLFVHFTECQSISTKSFINNDFQKRRPNVKLTIFNEGFYWGGTNNEGYLGDNLDGKYDNSIILIGDSYVEGFQLFERQHFMTFLKNRLENSLKFKYSIMNRGIGEHNLSDSYVSFRNNVNDTSKYIIFVNPDQLYMDSYVTQRKPYAYLENGRVSVESNFKKDRKYKIHKQLHAVFLYSTIFQSAKLLLNKIITRQHIEILFGKLSYLFTAKTKTTNTQSISNNQISEINKRILLDLKIQNNVLLVLMKNISKSQRNWLEINNIKVINLGIPLNNLKNNGVDPYYWKVTNIKGHWNHRAHKEIGEFIADVIIEDITK